MAEITAFRCKTREHSVVINTKLVDCDKISGLAFKILVYILSKGKGWKLYKQELYTHFKEGRTAINTAIKELKKFGYLIIDQERISGKFVGAHYKAFELSSLNPEFKGVVEDEIDKPDYGHDHNNKTMDLFGDVLQSPETSEELPEVRIPENGSQTPTVVPKSITSFKKSFKKELKDYKLLGTFNSDLSKAKNKLPEEYETKIQKMVSDYCELDGIEPSAIKFNILRKGVRFSSYGIESGIRYLMRIHENIHKRNGLAWVYVTGALNYWYRTGEWWAYNPSKQEQENIDLEIKSVKDAEEAYYNRRIKELGLEDELERMIEARKPENQPKTFSNMTYNERVKYIDAQKRRILEPSATAIA